MLLINLYNLLLISSTAFTKASESEGSKEEWPVWTIFEHTAPLPYSDIRYGGRVSTHSRPKAAGNSGGNSAESSVSFNTQPPEGGWRSNRVADGGKYLVSTHSRPKAAGLTFVLLLFELLFQHTAARRRLDFQVKGATPKA